MSNTELEEQVATPTNDVINHDFTLEVVEDVDTTQEDCTPETDENTPVQTELDIPDSLFILLDTQTNETTNTSQQNESDTRGLIPKVIESETSSPDTIEAGTATNEYTRPKRRRTNPSLNHFCSHCYFQASKISDFYIHQIYCRPKLNSRICEYCDFKTRSIKLLDEHVIREHYGNKRLCVPVSNKNIQTNESIFHLCGICSFKSVDVEEMDTHRASHDKWRMYLCDLCDFKDLSLVIIKRHRTEHRKMEGCV